MKRSATIKEAAPAAQRNDEAARGDNPAHSNAPILAPDFFARPAEIVARELIGKTLVRDLDDNMRLALTVHETEAYVGPHDLACHAAKGRTPRTEVMFGPPGHLYVYLIYGIHWMLNIVVEKEGYPAAVLIRGLAGIDGPGRVARTLALDRSYNGLPATPTSGLWFSDSGFTPSRRAIAATPRIGIDYAGPIWAAKKLRFVLKGR